VSTDGGICCRRKAPNQQMQLTAAEVFLTASLHKAAAADLRVVRQRELRLDLSSLC